MRNIALAGSIVMLLTAAAAAAPHDPLTLRNNDAGSTVVRGSKPTGTPVTTADAGSKDKAAIHPGLVPEWLKRNNDAGMRGKTIGAPPVSQPPVRP